MPSRSTEAPSFSILGPLSARLGERVVALGGVKQRMVLALLLLHAGEPVSVDRLIDAVWGDEPPPTAETTLQSYVSRLRKLLALHDSLHAIAPGYLLAVDDDRLDARRFEWLVADARAATTPSDVSNLMREALAMWRGPALSDLTYRGFVHGEITRLEDLRLAALEVRIEADLALGRHAELTGELETLTQQHPFREQLFAHRMLALYRAGRQSEALAAYRALRDELVENLGVDPSPFVRRREEMILRQDPDLDWTPAPSFHSVRPGRIERRDPPVTCYARAGDVRIAYQTIGAGPVDLIVVPGFVSHVEYSWEEPAWTAFHERIASFARLIHFDKRGTGLSDPITAGHTIEDRAEDILAVLDAAGSERAVVLAISEGAPLAAWLAVNRPERVRGLVFYAPFAVAFESEETPWAWSDEFFEQVLSLIENAWDLGEGVRLLNPSLDEERQRWYGRFYRYAASPSTARLLIEMNRTIDIRSLLPAIGVPTLVLHRDDDYFVAVEQSHYVASIVPGARLNVVPGVDHYPWVGDPEPLLVAIERFAAEIA